MKPYFTTDSDGPDDPRDSNGTPYTTLLIFGPKKEEAWKQFGEELLSWLNGRTKIVWRSRPAAEQRNGHWIVRARLTAYP